MKDVPTIIVVCAPLSIPKDVVLGSSVHDNKLISAIVEYRKKLEGEDVEVFTRKNNVIVTEKGYYAAVYEEDLKTAEGDVGVKPFMDVDGKMKIVLLDKDNKPYLQDLALLVATSILPNPNNYKFIRHIDGDRGNCQADNLEWSETEN